MKYRTNISQSRPDAELIQVLPKAIGKGNYKKLYIVIDAKYYKSELSLLTLDKTVDDMHLRKAYGLIICSEDTKIGETIEQYSAKRENLSLVKLQTQGPADVSLTGKLLSK